MKRCGRYGKAIPTAICVLLTAILSGNAAGPVKLMAWANDVFEQRAEAARQTAHAEQVREYWTIVRNQAERDAIIRLERPGRGVYDLRRVFEPWAQEPIPRWVF